MNPDILALSAWLEAHPLLGLLFIVWSVSLKGMALWKAAGLRQKYWFVILLVVNVAGILELIYLLFVAPRYKIEVIETEGKH